MTINPPLDPQRFSIIQRRALIVPIAAAILLAVLLTWRIESLRSAAHWVDHTDQVISQANLTERLLIDGETGVRGYYVSRKDHFLQPYDAAKKLLPGAFKKLAELVSDNDAQVKNVSELQERALNWQKLADESLQLAKQPQPSFEAANEDSKKVMDDIRERFDSLIGQENNLRSERSEALENAARLAVIAGLIVTFMTGVFLAFRSRHLMRLLSSNYQEVVSDLLRQGKDLQESREWFSTTLNSIGDAVIVVDVNSRVVLLNPLAERLTGWRYDDARSKPMHEVFNIINEETRQPAFNPVSRVLAEGIVVGLANHTILISKDGHEYPIEDSAAPVRFKSGRVDGVVLVFRDVSERHLNQKNLEAAVRIRDEFMSIASHELNTPLSTLKLQLEMTQMGLKNNEVLSLEKLKEAIDLCYGQTERLAGLVEDLLDVSRIQSGRLAYQFEEVNLTQMAQEIFNRFKNQFSEANCSFEMVPEGPVIVSCDRFRIDQLVSNLLMNALKYAGKSSVEIRVKEEGDWAVLSISDKGPGIPKDKQDLIFERFERAVDNNKISGLGLGLFISRQIATGHNGTLTVESEFGNGSIFSLKFPKTQKNQI